LAWQTNWGCHRQTEPAIAQSYGGGRWVGELLDESLVMDDGSALKDSSKPEFRIKQSGGTWDLSKINFDKLQPLSPLCLTRGTVSSRARPVLLCDLLSSWTLLRGHKRVIC
jgi:hypothetical protein